jgi:hypothetical protein
MSELKQSYIILVETSSQKVFWIRKYFEHFNSNFIPLACQAYIVSLREIPDYRREQIKYDSHRGFTKMTEPFERGLLASKISTYMSLQINLALSKKGIEASFAGKPTPYLKLQKLFQDEKRILYQNILNFEKFCQTKIEACASSAELTAFEKKLSQDFNLGSYSIIHQQKNEVSV